MDCSVKATLTLPPDILSKIERGHKERRETRGVFIRATGKQIIGERQAQGDIERCIRGYEERPQSDEEIASAEQLSRAVFADEPWE